MVLSIPPCDAGSIWLVTCGSGSLAYRRSDDDDLKFGSGGMRPPAFTLQKGSAFYVSSGVRVWIECSAEVNIFRTLEGRG